MVACVIGLGISDEEIAFTGPLTRFASNATVSLASNYPPTLASGCCSRWCCCILGPSLLCQASAQAGRRHAARLQGTADDRPVLP